MHVLEGVDVIGNDALAVLTTLDGGADADGTAGVAICDFGDAGLGPGVLERLAEWVVAVCRVWGHEGNGTSEAVLFRVQ